MTPSWRTGLLICLAVASASPLRAGSEPVLFQPGDALVGGAKPLLAMHPAAANAAAPHTAASLFTGQSGASLFAPLPARPSRAAARAAARAAEAQARTVAAAAQVSPSAPQSLPALTQIQRLRHLIAQAEAGAKGYDAVQHGAKIKPDTAPTQMKVQDIYDWIAVTPGQHHAIGRYQFIPATLKRLVAKLGVGVDEVFSPGLQDRLGDTLLLEAGFAAFRQGRMTRHAFMNNMAKIWAGLPNSSGKSHYDGYAGNKATMTWARFDRDMAQIFPAPATTSAGANTTTAPSG